MKLTKEQIIREFCLLAKVKSGVEQRTKRGWVQSVLVRKAILRRAIELLKEVNDDK